MAKTYLRLIKAALDRGLEIDVICAEEGDYLSKGAGYKATKDAIECVEMVNVRIRDSRKDWKDYRKASVAVFAIIPAYAEDDEDIVDYGGPMAEELLLLAGGIGFMNGDGEVVYVR